MTDYIDALVDAMLNDEEISIDEGTAEYLFKIQKYAQEAGGCSSNVYGNKQISAAVHGEHPCSGCTDGNSDGERCLNENDCLAWQIYED